MDDNANLTGCTAGDRLNGNTCEHVACIAVHVADRHCDRAHIANRYFLTNLVAVMLAKLLTGKHRRAGNANAF